MERQTVLVEVFTEMQAISCCQALEAKGIASRFEGPATTGNSVIDWNLPTTGIKVYVNEPDLRAAELVIADLDLSGEGELEEPETEVEDEAESIASRPLFDSASEAGHSEADRISKEAVQARNACILSLLMACLLPLAVYMVLSVSKKSLRPQDSRNLSIGIITIIVTAFLWILLFYQLR